MSSPHKQIKLTSAIAAPSGTAVAVLFASVTMYSHAASANDWTFEPFVAAEEQFTDNVFGTTNNEKSDFITTLDLGFNVTGNTRRSEINLSYTLSQDYYAKYHELDGYRQNLIGNATVELIDDRFFVDGRVTFTEETLDTVGATSAGNRTQSGDRTQVFNGSISPYYTQNLDDWAILTAKYGYSETRFYEPNVGADTANPSNQQSNEFQLNLGSGIRFEKLKWSFDNRAVFNESDVGDEFTHYSSVVTGEIPVSRMFSFLGTIGYDEFDINSISDEDDLGGIFGGTGIRFHPNSRTDASFQIGHRFDDLVFDVNVSYLPTSQDSISATYTVNINAADYSLANTDILDEQGELVQPDFSVARYIDGVSKTKSLQVSWQGSRGRNSYGLSGNYIEQEILEDNSSERNVGISGNFSRQLTPRANLRLSAGLTEVIDGQTPSAEETVYSFGANYIYEFGNGLSASAGYSNLTRKNDSSGDITENSFTVGLRKAF
ncbi:TIGR03016 family PEP-CTERM system-associated outer membrane protein [Sneathiella glossodoripedis]|uniref:TIGR03016 family PEP-CTERM system-associated outer membrane protein n=1 Tax=Sneathiella glossodoripedis TaxID=418853 RepID=UPI000470E1A6|nr:TIGR03016 family PEP-CTERM system-associated outer membrane protein [Sneathiella glossodoripedis]